MHQRRKGIDGEPAVEPNEFPGPLRQERIGAMERGEDLLPQGVGAGREVGREDPPADGRDDSHGYEHGHGEPEDTDDQKRSRVGLRRGR